MKCLKQKKGNKYILVIIDLATNEFDIEPLKGSKKIFIPYASIRTDNGKEFKGVFDKFCNNNNIFHKVNIQNRHSQLANVDSLCNQLERLFNGYMNHKEEETGKVYKNWDDIILNVRKGLNKIRYQCLSVLH